MSHLSYLSFPLVLVALLAIANQKVEARPRSIIDYELAGAQAKKPGMQPIGWQDAEQQLFYGQPSPNDEFASDEQRLQALWAQIENEARGLKQVGKKGGLTADGLRKMMFSHGRQDTRLG